MSATIDAARGVCRLVALDRFADNRGVLDVAQVGGALPFVAQRFFVVSAVPEGTTRGGHGHRSTEELLVAMRGRVLVELRASGRTRTVVLDRPSVGLYLAPNVWAEQRFFDGAMLLVLASDLHDPANDVDLSEQATGDVGEA